MLMPACAATRATPVPVPARARTPWRIVVAFVALAAAAMLALWPAAGNAQGKSWEPGADGLLPIPPLRARVTDLTQTFSPAETQALDAKLADWEARTTNQLAVLLVPTTLPEPIESYSIRVAEAWKVGRKGNDNGVLFLVAKNDKKMRIEVGYGLEGTLTDVTSRRIIAENVAPLFRDGKFAAGIDAGVDRIISVVAEGKPLPPPAAKAAAKGADQGFDFGTLALLLFIVVPLVGRVLQGMFGKLAGSAIGGAVVGGAAWFLLGSIALAVVAGIVGFVVVLFAGGAAMLSSGRGGSGWGGGGGSGGGFSGGGGGFSGGGGSFGGGGASGSWN